MASKDKVVATISGAKASLEKALADLEHLPAFDAGQIAFAAHALSNFLGVIRGTAELLLISLRDSSDIRARIRVEALVHAADLMTHTVNQLMNTSAPAKPTLVYDYIDLTLLVEKACDYYKRVAAKRGLVSCLPPPRRRKRGVTASRSLPSWITCSRMPSSTLQRKRVSS